MVTKETTHIFPLLPQSFGNPNHAFQHEQIAARSRDYANESPRLSTQQHGSSGQCASLHEAVAMPRISDHLANAHRGTKPRLCPESRIIWPMHIAARSHGCANHPRGLPSSPDHLANAHRSTKPWLCQSPLAPLLPNYARTRRELICRFLFLSWLRRLGSTPVLLHSRPQIMVAHLQHRPQRFFVLVFADA